MEDKEYKPILHWENPTEKTWGVTPLHKMDAADMAAELKGHADSGHIVTLGHSDGRTIQGIPSLSPKPAAKPAAAKKPAAKPAAAKAPATKKPAAARPVAKAAPKKAAK